MTAIFFGMGCPPSGWCFRGIRYSACDVVRSGASHNAQSLDSPCSRKQPTGLFGSSGTRLVGTAQNP